MVLDAAMLRQAATMILKEGAARGCTPRVLGSIVSRERLGVGPMPLFLAHRPCADQGLQRTHEQARVLCELQALHGFPLALVGALTLKPFITSTIWSCIC